MKKTLFIIVSLMVSTALFAQEEYIYDFNNLTEGTQNLNGQDGWSTHFQTASNSQDFDVAIVNNGIMTHDETIGIFYPYGGSGVGRTATRKASPDFNFSFQDGGVMDLEIDMYRNWWGVFFGIGYDSDNDGNVLPGMTDSDGGVYLSAKSQGSDNHTVVHFPNSESVQLDYEAGGWTRYKLTFDFSAYDGAGALTVFVKENCEGEWIQMASCTNHNMGLTPGSGDKNDYQMWDGIFFHSQGGVGGFDNILVRKSPEGNVQYIDMADIPNQLTINPPITLTATATSGLDVSFELVSGPATLDDNILSLTGEEGSVTVKAYQAGNDVWLPAADVYKTFEVYDPSAYTPEVTIRRPYDGSKVYMTDLHAMLLVVSAYIEHGDAILIEQVTCTIDGQECELETAYPDNPNNGYFYTTWTPSDFGTYNMIVDVHTSGGKITTLNSSFEVTDNFETQQVVTLNGDLVCTPSIQSVRGEYPIPSHVGAFNHITAYYDHNCVNGNCDTYDRVGGIRVRNYRGEWMELFRYISPFGVQCEDDIDVTDYTSVLQGLVEFEFYFETWNGSGFNPILTFTFEKGTPEYLYADVDEILYDTYAFGDYANLTPVPVVDFDFAPNTEKAILKMTTTGHNWSSNTPPNYTVNTGNAAEFYEATHNIFIDNQLKFTQDLWRTCEPNPAGCQPQNGTWWYSRSGWCPGSIPLVWNWDISDYLSSGCISMFYQFEPSYIDLCHPNYPDCVDGQNGCPRCNHPDNPILKVAAKIVSFSNYSSIFLGVDPVTPPEKTYSVNIFPNPADETVTMTSDYQFGKTSVLIINMEGQVVRQFAFSGTTQLKIDDLPSGTYIVRFLGDTMITKKLVIK